MPWETKYGSNGVSREVWEPYRMPRWPDQIIDSVFYLYPSVEDAERAADAGACGFLVSVSWDHPRASETSRHLYAVSNYHAAVQSGASVLRLNTKDGRSGVIETDPSEWFWQAGADVAIYRIDGSVHLQEQSIWQYSHSYFPEVNCSADILLEYELGPGDDVFSIGRFVDIHGIQQNTPFIRSGIIASKGPVKVRTTTPWQEESCWIVEMRSRTGFSGSPVFAYIAPWQPNFTDAPKRRYGNFFEGPWLLGIHAAQIPGTMNSGDTSGMTSVVPCSALEALLTGNESVRKERAKYEDRFIDRPLAELESSEASTKADNPSHKEDFNRLLREATRGPKTGSET